MHISLDEPEAGAIVPFSGFVVVGWLWLDAEHDELAAVEVWTGEFLLAETTSLYARPDVSSLMSAPSTARTGFFIPTALPDGETAEIIALAVCARFRDGRRTRMLTRVEIRPAPPACDPLRTLRTNLPPNPCGLEIGAHEQPVPGLAPYYVDAVADFAGTAGRVDFLADALALPVPDGALDYLCSSHVIEHLTDPLAGLFEWHRVLRPQGWLYLVAPDKRATFDAPRATTTAAHVLDDFRRAASARDSLEHVDEFLQQTNWTRLRPDCPPEEKPQLQRTLRERYLALIAEGHAIDVHFHTFTPDSLRAILHVAGLIGGPKAKFELVACAERYPPARADGIAFLLRKAGEPLPSVRRAAYEWHARGIPAPLPLVCPVTLEPLRKDADDALVSTRRRARYEIAGDRPVLLPPRNARPRRHWNTRLARLRVYVTGRLRLAGSETTP